VPDSYSPPTLVRQVRRLELRRSCVGDIRARRRALCGAHSTRSLAVYVTGWSSPAALGMPAPRMARKLPLRNLWRHHGLPLSPVYRWLDLPPHPLLCHFASCPAQLTQACMEAEPRLRPPFTEIESTLAAALPQEVNTGSPGPLFQKNAGFSDGGNSQRTQTSSGLNGVGELEDETAL
jgi:hypothetical protein